MSRFSDEVVAKAEELHDNFCVPGCTVGPETSWFLWAEAQLAEAGLLDEPEDIVEAVFDEDGERVLSFRVISDEEE